MDRTADWQPTQDINQPSFPPSAECIVPTIVQLELDKWLTSEVGENQADQVIAYTQNCLVDPLDTKIALQASECHRQYKLATADAIVYSTAILNQASILTCEAHFDNLSIMVYITKIK